MKSLIALTAAMPLLLGNSASPGERAWQIVQHDYVEFCADVTLTWNLNSGELNTVKGGCDPHRNSPPKITSKKLVAADLRRLRILTKQAADEGIAIQPCNTIPVYPLSGPIEFIITVGRRQLHSPNCMNDLGHRLEAAMTASIGQG